MLIKRKENILPRSNKIIVSLTTWKPRIEYTCQVIKSILEQTYKSDLFYFVLSKKDFPNMEEELPEYILNIKKTCDFFKIIWMDSNIKWFKNIIPIMQLHWKEDCIYYFIEDDVYYKPDYINATLKYFLDANKNKKSVITYNFSFSTITNWEKNENNRMVIGPYMIIKSDFIDKVILHITEEDIESCKVHFSADEFMTFLLHKHNIRFKMLDINILKSLTYETEANIIEPLSSIHANQSYVTKQIQRENIYDKYKNLAYDNQ